MHKTKLKPHRVKLLKDHKYMSNEFYKLRGIVNSKKYQMLEDDEKVLLYRQYNLMKELVVLLDTRIDLMKDKSQLNAGF